MISVKNSQPIDCERLLPIIHSSDREYLKTAFKMFLPKSIDEILRGEVKTGAWRQNHMQRIAPKPRLDIVRHLLTSNEPPRGSMLQILELQFVVKIKELGKY